jgi:hypothetical protein
VHLVIDADSHEVRAVEMTDHRHGNGEIVPGLLAQVPKSERIGVTSGGAYDTRGVCEASAAREAALVVPPRRNGKPWKARTTGAAARNESLRAISYLSRKLWKRWSGCRRRSLAETAMSLIKRLGERIAPDPVREHGTGTTAEMLILISDNPERIRSEAALAKSYVALVRSPPPLARRSDIDSTAAVTGRPMPPSSASSSCA